MASNKYKLILGLITLITTTTFAQMGTGYSVLDSSVIPSKRQPQQNEFLNNTYNFPAKPRNQIEIGLSLGNIAVTGDVNSRMPRLAGALHVRKALGYIFSLRLQYLNGSPKGMSYQPSAGYINNPAWRTAYSNFQPVFYNYKTHLQDLGLQGLFSLNNIRFHKQKSKVSMYAGAGVGASWYNVKVNALNGNTPYTTLFNSIAAAGDITWSNRRNIYKRLKDGMDNTYETVGETEDNRSAKLGKNSLKPSLTVIFGVSYKLSNRVNIALEDRHTFVKTDLLDGQRWQEHPISDPALTPQNDSYNYLSLGINFNLGAKSVEPLWWLNPLDYAYSEINNPKHMKLPKPILDDADGDGVTDQLDREPNTPAGCPVDSHGVTRDTDGDGVPDCKDKQLITPTECQPVDADGVGKCPDPACCTAISGMLAAKDSALNACASDYPSLSVKGTGLSGDTKALLANVATKLKDKPNCTITITAYPGASKKQQSLADKKLNVVKNYLVEKLGISADRVSVDKVIDGGDANTIDIKSN
jgi:opacity protein-like surface antigen